MSFIHDEKEIQSLKQEIVNLKNEKTTQPSLSNRIFGFVFGVFASFLLKRKRSLYVPYSFPYLKGCY